MEIADATFVAFTFCNTLRTLAYVPQIYAAARDGRGCDGISCLTWSLFLVAHATAVAYAIINVRDPGMALVFAANAFCCAAIVGTVAVKRWRHAHRHAGVKSASLVPST